MAKTQRPNAIKICEIYEKWMPENCNLAYFYISKIEILKYNAIQLPKTVLDYGI